LCLTLIGRYEQATEQKSLTITLLDAPSQSEIFADELAAVQILDNLLSNAVKYSPHGKTITVSVTTEKSTESDNDAGTSLVCVRVQDEGQGIPEEEQTRLFQKFSKLSTRPTGGEHSTGLGLSIAKKLADLMNASLHVESTVGKGTAFIVKFPTQAPPITV
jgi:signal transduction histidine kinase